MNGPAQPVLSDEEVERKVIEVIATTMDRPVSEITPASSLEMDLGAQSLDYLDIAFSLERAFRVQFPRADFLQRASDHFGEENLVKDGVVTDLGLRLLRVGMPELGPAQLKPGCKVTDIRRMVTVATFIRVAKQLLQNKAAADRTCPKCGAQMDESDSLPEFVCPACQATVPLPSGDNVLFDQLVQLEQAVKAADPGKQ
jgi:acyl carrier protein